MQNNTCPVCGKPSIGDYLSAPINCPQCESNLSAYQLLHQLKKTEKDNPILKSNGFIFSSIAAFLLLLFLSFVFWQDHRILKQTIAFANTKNVALMDSIAKVNLLYSKPAVQEDSLNRKELKYKIKKGDYLWKIAVKYYGDGQLFKKIEKDNRLIAPYYLKIGQPITIYLD